MPLLFVFLICLCFIGLDMALDFVCAEHVQFLRGLESTLFELSKTISDIL
jgi:hypothetical protein